MVCESCFEKQRRIDELTEENIRLQQQLRHYQKKTKQGYFGANTSSSKIPVKPNQSPDKPKKKPGAKPGHKGHGRQRITKENADQVVKVYPEIKVCPHGHGELHEHQMHERGVLDMPPLKIIRLVQLLVEMKCPVCNFRVKAQAQNVMPKNLYSNTLLSNIAMLYYQHGIPLRRLSKIFGLRHGSLIHNFYRLGQALERIYQKIMTDYRASRVKHADETSWRIAGKNAWAWIFCTLQTVLFHFAASRKGEIARNMIGKSNGNDVVVVDRYGGYNAIDPPRQFCFAHLLRDVKQLEKDFPDNQEISKFQGIVAPLLSEAMKLRNQPINDELYYVKAKSLKRKIMRAANHDSRHPAIAHIQDIFLNQKKQLFHWTKDRRIPAENNQAERDIRRTVISRKLSFGSQSISSAHMRSVLMSVLHTLDKRQHKQAADQSFENILNAIEKKNRKLSVKASLLPRPLYNF
ncbi:MAG: IS66 family transposase [Deltaproteobacteria bacterium]|nr:IS66 family transposase [Deltaproteobacteria bacterium]